MDKQQVRSAVSAVMSEVVADLRVLSAIPSVAFPGFPSEPVIRAAKTTVDLLRRYGVDNARLLHIPHGYPAVYGEIAGPEGAPTVMLYGHYDVQPAPAEQVWTTAPFTPVERGGRLYARGAADDKSGILQHAAAIKVLGRNLPVSVKILIEGEKETTSHLDVYVEAKPDLFQCGVFLINDAGNASLGEPVLAIPERGDVARAIEMRTLDHSVLSGKPKGARPEARVTLDAFTATDDSIPTGPAESGLEGADVPASHYRESPGVADGASPVRGGTLISRPHSIPSVTILGIDAPSVDEASNHHLASRQSRLSVSLVPGRDGEERPARSMWRLESTSPYGPQVKVGQPFRARTDGPALKAARRAMTDAFGREAHLTGSCASSPLFNALESVAPAAEFILWGAQDGDHARIHGADESVDLAELERCIVAQVLFFQMYGDAAPS
jgi:acetylornithine deacetylase/succinyl-diaminopimelate desuccinylase-like protein